MPAWSEAGIRAEAIGRKADIATMAGKATARPGPRVAASRSDDDQSFSGRMFQVSGSSPPHFERPVWVAYAKSSDKAPLACAAEVPSVPQLGNPRIDGNESCGAGQNGAKSTSYDMATLTRQAHGRDREISFRR